MSVKYESQSGTDFSPDNSYGSTGHVGPPIIDIIDMTVCKIYFYKACKITFKSITKNNIQVFS